MSAINLHRLGAGRGMKDSDDRRNFFERVTGKRSQSLMSPAEVAKVASAIREITPAPKSKGKPLAPRASLRYVHVLWGLLGRAGKLNQPNRAGLNKFIRARFAEKWGVEFIDIDALTEEAQITDVIRALEDWCDREGVEREL